MNVFSLKRGLAVVTAGSLPRCDAHRGLTPCYIEVTE